MVVASSVVRLIDTMAESGEGEEVTALVSAKKDKKCLTSITPSSVTAASVVLKIGSGSSIDLALGRIIIFGDN